MPHGSLSGGGWKVEGRDTNIQYPTPNSQEEGAREANEGAMGKPFSHLVNLRIGYSLLDIGYCSYDDWEVKPFVASFVVSFVDKDHV